MNTVRSGTYDQLPRPRDAAAFVVTAPPDLAGLYLSDGTAWTISLVEGFNGGVLSHSITVDPSGGDEPSLKIGESTEPPEDTGHSQLFTDPDDGKLKVKLEDGSVVEVGGGGGGSQPFEVVRVPIAFNTPGLVVAGINLGYTLAVGDILLADGIVSVTTAWNGTTPRLYLYAAGGDPINNGDQFFTANLTNVDSGYAFGFSILGNSPGNVVSLIATSAIALRALVDNNNGADPGSSQGAGEIVLAILKASE